MSKRSPIIKTLLPTVNDKKKFFLSPETDRINRPSVKKHVKCTTCVNTILEKKKYLMTTVITVRMNEFEEPIAKYIKCISPNGIELIVEIDTPDEHVKKSNNAIINTLVVDEEDDTNYNSLKSGLFNRIKDYYCGMALVKGNMYNMISIDNNYEMYEVYLEIIDEHGDDIYIDNTNKYHNIQCYPLISLSVLDECEKSDEFLDLINFISRTIKEYQYGLLIDCQEKLKNLSHECSDIIDKINILHKKTILHCKDNVKSDYNNLKNILDGNYSYNNFEDFNKFQTITYRSNRELSNLIGQYYKYKNFTTEFEKLISNIKNFKEQLEENY